MITPNEALHRCIEHREIFHDEMLHLMRMLMRGEMSPAIAANPFVSFFAVANESGTIGLRWTGDEGFVVEERVVITVE